MVGGLHLLVLAFDLFLSLFWLMVNLTITSLPTGVSTKGTRYHLICFYCVQRGYIHSFNKLKFRARPKESLFVVQAQKFHTCSLSMTACCFVGLIHKSVAVLWRFRNNMKKHQSNK